MLYTYWYMWMIHSLLEIFFPARCLGCKQEGVSLCKRCLTLARKSLSTPVPFIASYYDFRDPLIKRAIHAIKYKHRKELISPLASAAASLLQHTSESILVPIPMPAFRRLLRGYNHAEEIALVLGKIHNLKVNIRLLKRIKITKRQAATLRKGARLDNQKNSFSSRDVSGLHIILIDDVATTGATLEEARKELLSKGASSVQAFTLAH